MNKYLKVFWKLLGNNLALEMQYRKNFTIRFFSQFLFVVLQVVLMEVYFRFTNQIGSWSRIDVFTLVGIFRLVEGVFHILFHSSLLALPENVNDGELDGLIIKPINTLFIVSLKQQQWYELSTWLSGLVIIIYAVGGNVLLIAKTILASILGSIAIFSVMLIVSSLSFYFTRLTAISSVWDAISKTSRFPLDIFSTKLLFLISPLFLISTLPSQLVLGKVGSLFWILQCLGSGLFFIIAYKFWKISLKHYSSASS